MNSKLFEEIRQYAQSVLSNKRYEHSMRTAETAAKMCALYGIAEEKGWVAGIAHDICKEISDEEMLLLAKKDGRPISDMEKNIHGLLHGRAAAVLIQEKFDVSDLDLIEAVANHTFACENLCDLGKILFAADKIEPGRPQSTDEYRANLFSMSLNKLALTVIEENISYLEKKGKSVAPESLDFARWLKTL